MEVLAQNAPFVQLSLAQKRVVVCNPRLLFHLRIADSRMVNRLQFLDKYSFGIGNITECDGTLLEVALCDLTIDELVDKFSNGLFRIVRQRT